MWHTAVWHTAFIRDAVTWPAQYLNQCLDLDWKVWFLSPQQVPFLQLSLLLLIHMLSITYTLVPCRLACEALEVVAERRQANV